MRIRRSNYFENTTSTLDRCITDVKRSKAKMKYLVSIKVDDPTEEVIKEQIAYLKYNHYGNRITRVGMTEKDGLHVLYFKCTGAKQPVVSLCDVTIEYADESGIEESSFYSDLKMALDFYVGNDYKLEGKFGDKVIKVLVDEKILFILERVPGVNNNYGISFMRKCEENFIMQLLGVPGIVDLYWR